MNIKRELDTIYELDENDTNKWSFNIQAGYGKNSRQPQSVIDKVATLMENAENLRVALTAAMDYINESPCDPDITESQFAANKIMINLNVEELLNKLK
jgi:hypothetical protein